jgi:hypothetical protein
MKRVVVRTSILSGLLFLGLGSFSGCTTFIGQEKSASVWPWQKSEEKPKLPTRILTIWTDAIHHQAGEKAQRGFGGRVVFYADGEQPIQVDGTLTIYVFADEPGQESPSPERKYVFPASELKQHYSKCSLGDSYSVWLPWDVVGGTSRQLTLIARFDSGTGGTVMSDPAKKMLPGLSKRPISDAEAVTESAETSTLSAVGESARLGPLAEPQSLRVPDQLPVQGVSESRPTGPRPNTSQRATAKSIAEVLQEQKAAPSSTKNDSPVHDALDAEVAQVGYQESESDAISKPNQAHSSSANSRVETIELGRLRSNATSVVNVPQHLLHGLSNDVAEEDTDLSGAQTPVPQVPATPRTTVSYGRPGESRTNSNSRPPRDEEQTETSDEPNEEPWPRRSRTMGSGRRSIAESRRDAMAERPPSNK